MKLIIKQISTKKEIEISTEDDSAHNSVSPIFEKGDPNAIADFQETIEAKGHGFYGQIIILEETTNLDLTAAINKLEDYEIVEQIPADIKPLPKSSGGGIIVF